MVYFVNWTLWENRDSKGKSDTQKSDSVTRDAEPRNAVKQSDVAGRQVTQLQLASANSRPNVYHVHKHDLKGLEAAIKAARDTPIEYFIPDHMKFDAVCGYTAGVLGRDWRAEAEEEMRDRKARGEQVSRCAD